MKNDAHNAERRFGFLLAKLMEGSTTPEEAEWIAGRLRSSAAARKYYHDYVETHAILRWEHGATDESLTLTALDRIFNERREDDPPAAEDAGGPSFSWLEDSHVPRTFPTGLFLGSMLAVAALAILIVGGRRFFDRANDSAPSPVVVAEIVRCQDCEWNETSNVRKQKDPVHAGEWIDLERGRVQIRFPRGEDVFVEGPVRFQCKTSDRGYIESGTLTARVPSQGIGFGIETPTARVIDLGTEFGVSVAEKGLTRIQVFSGNVVVNGVSEPEDVRRLSQGEAVVSTSTEIRTEDSDEFEFVRAAGFFARNTTPGAKGPSLKSAEKGTFTVAVIGDTEKFRSRGVAADPQKVGWAVTNPVLDEYCRWIAENADAQRIVFVSLVGDSVLHNQPQQWYTVKTCLDQLHGRLPYGLTLGGRDMTESGDSSLFTQYFPIERFEGFDWFGGAYANPDEPWRPLSIANSYQLFSAEGLDFLVLHLESNPTDDVLRWANEVLTEHADRRAMVFTDLYLGPIKRPKSPTAKSWNAAPRGRVHWTNRPYPLRNDADAVWKKCLSKHANVFLVHSADNRLSQAVRRTAEGDRGNTVYELTADYGGAGMRLYNFRPRRNEIRAYTFSPFHDSLVLKTAIVPSAKPHQFTLKYDMGGKKK